MISVTFKKDLNDKRIINLLFCNFLQNLYFIKNPVYAKFFSKR